MDLTPDYSRVPLSRSAASTPFLTKIRRLVPDCATTYFRNGQPIFPDESLIQEIQGEFGLDEVEAQTLLEETKKSLSRK